ncbi:MAG: cytochrome P450 [Jatrophihabitantaceae bacterium]
MTVQDLGEIPGDNGLPLVGHTLSVLSGRFYNSRERYDRYGPVSWMRTFGRRTISVTGPEAATVVLQNRDHAFANGPGWSFLIGPFFHRGLMLLDFDEHHRHRRIMQQAFTSERLAGYLDPMNDTLAAGLARWQPRRDFRVYPALKQLTLDVATRTFMGEELGPDADRLNRAFADCVRGGTAVLRFPVPGLRWSRGLHGRRELERFLHPRIAGKRATQDADLFSALVHARADDGATFSDEDVVNHMIFLLMAAHDTTTITMTTMAYYLAKHPEWQERCRAESAGLGTPTLGFGHLDRLETLDRVMRECMRLVTAVPGVSRQAMKDTEILGYRVPSGSAVSVNMHGTHHLSEYWPDPERFDPDRFGPDGTVARNAWIPFGNGVHKCIGLHFGGMQVKAAMHQLLLSHRWSVARDYVMPIDWTSLPRPKDGLPVRLDRL